MDKRAVFSKFFITFAADMEETKQLSAYRQSLREKILDTAMRAFASQGIRAVKMDDIAQRLGISKRTLYEVYENKEVLLFEGLKKAMAMQERNMAQVVARSQNVMDVILYVYRTQIEVFQQVNPSFYSDLERYPQLLAYLNDDRQRKHQRTLDFLARGVAEGYFRKDVDYGLMMSIFEAASHQVMTRQLYRQYSIAQIFDNILFVMLRGICTKRGVEVLERVKSL